MEQTNIRSRAMLITVIVGLLVWAYFHAGIKLGQDLKGGTTLRYALDIEGAMESGRISKNADPVLIVEQTLEIIDKRINRYGLAETTLTQVGENKFEISLPAGSASHADQVDGVVSQLGDLKFRIEVKEDADYAAARAARSPPQDPPERKGIWQGEAGKLSEFIAAERKVYEAAQARGEEYKPTDSRYRLVKSREYGTFHLIEEVNLLDQAFDGGILENPAVSQDEIGDPVVVFDIKNEFQNVFGQWTGMNVGLPMAIILNDEYISAPVIQSKLTTNVQVTLGAGDRKALLDEAKQLTTVLQTGSLKIRPVQEAKTVMGATLAGESRERGVLSVLVAFALVLVFMMLYYRSSGIIANVALLLNLVMLIGFVAFFQAVLTLPGIAGIVLTVGMAVDANILINERIREERRSGRSLRRAVAEGYDRALSAIVDANVTSIITAIFLYNFGSGPVKGFAVTLAIGLMVSMFTSIFVTRTIFEGLMRNGMIKEVTAWGSGEPMKIRWLSLRRIFAPISVAAVVLGILVFQTTDKYTVYDIDFTGGYKIHAEFHEPTTPEQVGEVLATQARDVVVIDEGFDKETQQPFERKVNVKVGPYPDAQVLAAGEGGRGVEIKVQRLFKEGESSAEEAIEAKAFHEYVSLILGERLMPDWLVSGPERFTYVAPEGDDAGAGDPLEELSGGMTMRIAFRNPDGLLTEANLKQILEEDMPYWFMEEGRERPYKPSEKSITRKVVVRPVASELPGISTFDIWMLSTTAGGQTVENDKETLKDRVGEYLGGEAFRTRVGELAGLTEAEKPKADEVTLSQPFPSEDHIGSSVAQRLKNDAIVALVLSLIGIIIYIAIRFHSRAMGFAAVFCLFHDVAITLGLVALANGVGLVDAKINLAMVAAFLTLVGYSVNDTVVIFDRIRENRGKRPTITSDIIDVSINQTLTRTIRTSVTFLLVCLALFAFNVGQRNVLEGFAFVLILGSFIGTYSTIAIAAPLLMYLPWLWERLKGYAPKPELVTACVTNAALLILTPVAAVLYAAWWVLFAIGAFVAGLVMFVPWAMSGEEAQAIAQPVA